MADYKEIACNILEDTCETDEIFEDEDMDLLEAGYLDSFSLLNIIVELEAKLGVRLQPTDIQKEDIATVNRFVAYVEKIMNKEDKK